nr:hypothetical protein [Streptomyces sp. RLB1-33]
MQAQVTAAGKAGPFGYLDGTAADRVGHSVLRQRCGQRTQRVPCC